MPASLFINHFLISFILLTILDNSHAFRSSFFFNNHVVWSSNVKNSPPPPGLPGATGVMNGHATFGHQEEVLAAAVGEDHHDEMEDVVRASNWYYQRKQLLEKKLPASITGDRKHNSSPPSPIAAPNRHDPIKPPSGSHKMIEDEGKTLQVEELATNP
ncbi:unnamed protein product [Cuscuta epithymum]|uniref:Uncharacterized protein n=1 Tax=Cuscuta epithymum TaxID=186058 RepID=A0AAV0FR24_9ASTE|nr:unnamed protein product [Cuscuta epithymum]